MVSFWPWKREDNSPASFEKALSGLSTKINVATADLESKRQGLRRFKGLWTLTSIMVYLLYLMVAALAIGWRNWGAPEYSIVAAGPVVIYLVRLSVTAFYEFRISSSHDRLASLQKQRDTTVAKLKEATKYDTTLQLIEKYGGGSGKPPASKPEMKRKPASAASSGPNPSGKLTGVVPPPTANIPRAPSSATGALDRSAPFTPPPNPPHTAGPSPSNWQPPSIKAENAEFAPNAFNPVPQYVMDGRGSSWYDRLMDVLLGEDEMHPKNRLALICENCRLVNGQAAPGAKTLEAVGKWRCSNCHTMNGVDPIADHVTGSTNASPTLKDAPAVDIDPSDGDKADANQSKDAASDVTQYSDEEDAAPSEVKSTKGLAAEVDHNPPDTAAEAAPRRSTRGRKKKASS